MEPDPALNGRVGGDEDEDCVMVDGEGVGNRRMVSTDATQTEGDVVDGAALIQPQPLIASQNNDSFFDLSSDEPNCSHVDGGFLSSLFTMVLPMKKRSDSNLSDTDHNSRSVATQTEEQDPICARGQQLSLLLVQELSLQNPIPSSYRDAVYESLASCICDMLVKHSILFNGMVRRCHITHYRIFCCIANEIFEANETGQFNVSWGRIISLFAFAVRLAQEYKEDTTQVDCITRYLASYVTKHLIPFVRNQGGWVTLVHHYPVPVDDDAQVKRAILWSGLCVGLMATMYVTSYLSSR